MITTDTLNGSKCSVKVFDSVADLVDAVRVRCAESTGMRDFMDDHAGMSNWIGRSFRDGADCLNETDGTWEYGLEVLEQMLTELSRVKMPEPVSRQRRTRFSEDGGDEICLDRLRGGQPDFCGEPRRTPTYGQQVITINAAIGCRAGIKAIDVLWRGAAAVAMTKILEAAGYSVELWGTSHSLGVGDGDASSAFTAIKLKGAGDALNEASLVNACSAWFYRTAIFSSRYLTEKARPSGDTSCVGGTISQNESEGFAKHVTADPNVLILDDVFTFGEAVSVARQHLELLAQRAEGMVS